MRIKCDANIHDGIGRINCPFDMMNVNRDLNDGKKQDWLAQNSLETMTAGTHLESYTMRPMSQQTQLKCDC